jgi:hypothetical protein
MVAITEIISIMSFSGWILNYLMGYGHCLEVHAAYTKVAVPLCHEREQLLFFAGRVFTYNNVELLFGGRHSWPENCIEIKKTVMPSTVISGIEYEAVSQTLRITFVSGLVYNYQNVPPEIYHALKTSGAKGIYLNQNIKGKYPFEKVQ